MTTNVEMPVYRILIDSLAVAGMVAMAGAATVTSSGSAYGDAGYSVALCTVTPSAAEALAGNIVVDGIGNRAIDIRQESVMVGEEQMVRFTADVHIAGCSIIIR